jgi:hypothetical protein
MGQDLASANAATSRAGDAHGAIRRTTTLLHTLKRQRPTRACGVGLFPLLSSARIEPRVVPYFNM